VLELLCVFAVLHQRMLFSVSGFTVSLKARSHGVRCGAERTRLSTQYVNPRVVWTALYSLHRTQNESCRGGRTVRRSAPRLTCCKLRWTLSVTNLRRSD